MKFITVETWNQAFGESAKEALVLFTKTHPILIKKEQNLYLNIDLEIFDEPMELFAYEKDMVDRSIEISPLFRDSEIDAEWMMTILDLFEDELGYSPVNASGFLALYFEDIRDYYGITFDEDMSDRYPSYSEFKAWMNE